LIGDGELVSPPRTEFVAESVSKRDCVIDSVCRLNWVLPIFFISKPAESISAPAVVVSSIAILVLRTRFLLFTREPTLELRSLKKLTSAVFWSLMGEVYAWLVSS